MGVTNGWLDWVQRAEAGKARPAGGVRLAGRHVPFVTSASRTVVDLLEIVRDAHRILQRLEETMSRVECSADGVERATVSVEAALHALPSPLQRRIAKQAARLEQREPNGRIAVTR